MDGDVHMGASKRRIVRRTVLVLIVCALIAWLTPKEPQIVYRSHAVGVGMSRSDAEAVLGRAEVTITQRSKIGQVRIGLLFGLRGPFRDFMWEARSWLGLPSRPPVVPDDFPVLVWLDASDRVIEVNRGDEVKGAAARLSSKTQPDRW